MSIKSIRVKNLLSFDELIINNLKDINCIVGKNNVGKSNLLKLLRFFYRKLDGHRELPPNLNSNYSSYGLITITYDTSRIYKIVTSEKTRNNNKFFQHIYTTLFKNSFNKNSFELTLKINSNDSTKWSECDYEVLKIINYLYPFFDIETRHIDLYDWDKLWLIVSRLKSFNVNTINQNDVKTFFDEKMSSNNGGYIEYIDKIHNITKAGKYNYREKVLNYVKAGLKGQTFLINDEALEIQSDGTNSHRFIEIALELLISLSRREYISPTIYVDEPEIGLHPKKNEELIFKLHEVYFSFKKTKNEKEIGKYKTPYPKIIFVTHSPNIVKDVIKLFEEEQQILHFSKNNKNNTIVQKMNSNYDDKRFLNIFSDNEARLFFSNFILFVEGATEKELFSNRKLIDKFKNEKGQKFLQNIDVYETNDLVLKYINPSYSNTSIPYLVLYDADKFLEIDIPNRKLIFLQKVIDIKHYLKIYKNSYRGSPQNLIYNYLKLLMTSHNSQPLTLSENLLYVNNFYYSYFINQINHYFLLKENHFINKTTIEEVLINTESFALFKKWIYYKTIEKYYNYTIPLTNRKKIKKNKIILLKAFYKHIKYNFPDEKDQLTIFILVFGGKTETSITKSTENYNLLDDKYTDAIDYVIQSFSNSLKISALIGKTSGWVTSFLNFAIRSIEIEVKNKDITDKEGFEDKFKNKFRELYDIITIIKNKS